MSEEKTLTELADATGIPARTIRFYIARGLLEGPAKAGRGAVYTNEHQTRLEKIKALQAEGRMLSEIAPMLASAGAARADSPASPWWQYLIEDDVLVWTRADLSPWRLKQIRDAIDDFAARIAKTAPSNPTDETGNTEPRA